MESIVKQIEYLRNEIAIRDSQLMAGVMLIAVMMVACYMAAVISNNCSLYRLLAMLLLGGIFFVARQEHLEKRNAPWISKAETVLQSGATGVPRGFVNWEDYLKTLKSRQFYLFPTDLLCGLPFCWMFFDAIRNQLKLKAVISDQTFLWWAAAGLVFAILWVGVGSWAADK